MYIMYIYIYIYIHTYIDKYRFRKASCRLPNALLTWRCVVGRIVSDVSKDCAFFILLPLDCCENLKSRIIILLWRAFYPFINTNRMPNSNLKLPAVMCYTWRYAFPSQNLHINGTVHYSGFKWNMRDHCIHILSFSSGIKPDQIMV